MSRHAFALGRLFCAAVLIGSTSARSAADVFIMPTGQTSVELMRVAHAGNDPDPRYGASMIGSVDYTYNMGKFDVTAAQYTQFLNAVAGSDPYGLYNPAMSSVAPGTFGCSIQRSGASGDYSYSVAADFANRPVNYVSWGDAARFVNWIANGQPTGPQGLSTTEDGSYYLNGAMTDAALLAVTRKPGARFVLPTEDEWYKAAYFDPAKPGWPYWDYATRSDTLPSNVLSSTGANNANYPNPDGTYALGEPYWRTEVGFFAGSPSACGTFDQSGNVWQWNEVVLSSSYTTGRGLRGGSWALPGGLMSAGSRTWVEPTREDATLGFRIAEIPEPASIGMLALSALLVVKPRRCAERIYPSSNNMAGRANTWPAGCV